MIRHLAPMPATRSLGQLRDITRTRFPTLEDVNVVEEGATASLALYLTTEPAASEVTAWRADVAAHVPQSPTPEEAQVTAAQNQQTTRQQLATARTRLLAIRDSADPGAGTLTTAQLSTIVRQLADAVQDLARGELWLGREVLGDHSGTDT